MCTDITSRKGKLTITVIDKDKRQSGDLHIYMCTDITTRKGKLTITVIDKDKGKEGIFPSTCVLILQLGKVSLQ